MKLYQIEFAYKMQPTVFSCVLKSTNKEHLLTAGTGTGDICVFSLNENESQSHPRKHTLHSQNGPIYDMLFASDSLLVAGGDECIRLHNISDVCGSSSSTNSDSAVSLHYPDITGIRGSRLSYAETNGLAFDHNSNSLFAAAGDNNAYCWDLNTKQLLCTYKGHTDYLHCCCCSTNRLCTGSEDGTVRIWDTRNHECTHILYADSSIHSPTSNHKHSRFKWVSCISMDHTGDWLAVGSGERFISLWYLPTMTVISTMPTQGVMNTVKFSSPTTNTIPNTIIAAGDDSCIYHFKRTGETAARIRTDSRRIYSLALGDQSLSEPALISGETDGKIRVFVHPLIQSYLLEV